jgi:hypothetical protein
MTTQQPMPNILDQTTQAAWDAWADERIDNQLESYTEAIAEEVGIITGRHAQKIVELLEIMQVLAVGNAFLGGRIAPTTRELKYQNGIEHKQAPKTIARTIATTTTEESTLSKTLSIVDEVLHGH